MCPVRLVSFSRTMTPPIISVENLEKRFHEFSAVKGISFEVQKGEIFACSATVQIPGDMLKVERTADDLYKAIDKVKDHLRETLSQRKDRLMTERKADGTDGGDVEIM